MTVDIRHRWAHHVHMTPTHTYANANLNRLFGILDQLETATDAATRAGLVAAATRLATADDECAEEWVAAR
jgi:2-hydroxychromene-2-carboxylate isomerase